MKVKWQRRSLTTLASLIGICISTPLWAQTQDTTQAGSDTAATQQEVATAADSKAATGDTMVVTAQQQVRQALGASTITAEDIRKRPPANDLSEIIRTMPGVNLSGNSASGQRGNNRQIDIRGMGPENTLIMIDGIPVSSRNAVRYGWRGERDTRGDTNWVPANMVEKIEVLRGPAAARYGNGAAGGVVNIITKQPDKELHGSWNAYMNLPQHSEEGATRRTDFSLLGPLSDTVSFRLYGGYNKTDADDWDINQGHESARTGNQAGTLPAGREGVRNKDINGLLRWEFAQGQSLEFEAGYSRQGNIYAGDTQNTNSNAIVRSLYGAETNVMYRDNFSLTHRGFWDNGVSTTSYVQYENTRNSRINEGLAGGTEGIFSNNYFSTIKLDNYLAHSEVNLPFELGVNQVLTVGAEWNDQKMNDPTSNTQTTTEGGSVSGLTGTGRNTRTSAQIASVFVEDNIELTDTTMLTPALRFDHHSTAGSNWSPGLNLSQELGDYFTMKMGIARAYKAPNLYQTNPNYLLYSRGQGCYGGGGSCYLMGNDDLSAETSVNKEIGFEFHDDGIIAGITYFRNDYRNKIEPDLVSLGTANGGTGTYANSDIFKWENVPKALVEGLEGNLTVPFTDTVQWSSNLTYMLESKNKTTGDYLSITPEFTLNSSVNWQVTDDLSLLSTVTWYGRQKPKKYDYQGLPVTGTARNEVSPYAIFGLSASYTVTKNVSVTTGIENLFDKRQFREGNAQNVANIAGAGAATYNEPGRTYFVSLNTQF
ncbi:TPA: TonB-dependent siderophore receptor [Yersinia enterocolitica]|uniref:TonB-dependent siderophore receptor n=1 Tax=Yersinia enterocolitica TaxID=630 RepID=UPI0020C3F61D|nr:TonB-dependent siderophore receptor [Yersinia enterocolitica]HDL6852992.1 TonB-dependent siderophore receptor [Yersinia enterocolitica]HDL6856858.1 TonB-dependent siderophore receptor [Yersinia enterocolitica]HDL6861316.1 TonB-dependent siderophore receptor [Yersinia enterocolitica]HDL6864710.1 TonB-dependent siderophore receptor [Yersinia enterocolitica]HDL6868663.1 TonB-dependent siderophore receptor [Yersinia enterocolitica]